MSPTSNQGKTQRSQQELHSPSLGAKTIATGEMAIDGVFLKYEKLSPTIMHY